MIRLAPLYILCFLASFPLLPPAFTSKPQYMWLVRASAANSTEKHYKKEEDTHHAVSGIRIRDPCIQAVKTARPLRPI
jgi:hypothetical protein